MTAWFELNALEEAQALRKHSDEPSAALGQHTRHTWPAQNILYSNIPNHYVWDSKNTTWLRRRKAPKGGMVLGRMFAVNPKHTELFALRILLLHSPGARSFEDLRFVNGQQSETFREAAQARGLLRSDEEMELTLDEIVHSECSTASSVTVLLFCWFGMRPPTRDSSGTLIGAILAVASCSHSPSEMHWRRHRLTTEHLNWWTNVCVVLACRQVISFWSR